MTDYPSDSAGLVNPGEPPAQQAPSSNGGARIYAEPAQETLRAHLAGIEQPDFGTPSLWLSDDVTTMHFPLTEATVPALLAQLSELAADYRAPRGGGRSESYAERDLAEAPYDADDAGPEVGPQPEANTERVEDPAPSRLARWTGWHYSNSMVSRIPPQQRVALFAAVLVILLLITLFNHH
ncbi:MAG TPA: hypothetical protein VHX59_26185 [Mycobacteriales bacterium]|jgi:hypothetical protein|nr:hypothetical protein [Mycobacteriales bacterium]